MKDARMDLRVNATPTGHYSLPNIKPTSKFVCGEGKTGGCLAGNFSQAERNSNLREVFVRCGVKQNDLRARLCGSFREDNLGNSQRLPSIVTLSTAIKWSYQGLINRYCGQLFCQGEMTLNALRRFLRYSNWLF